MEIFLHSKFEKKFEKLPEKIRNQYYERVGLFKMNKYDSLLNNHSVDKAYPGYRSINITGDYRVIFKEVGDKVTFRFIGTHSELY